MKTERADVKSPMWRKKVDRSLFDSRGTPLPAWMCKVWQIAEVFGTTSSRRDERAGAKVTFKGKSYDGWVTTQSRGRKNPLVRLFYDPLLAIELKKTYLMSYMRSLEEALGARDGIETTIPFWEFLDIEFDAATRTFKFVVHYRQEPIFPSLFRRLIGSPALQSVEDVVNNKPDDRIHKLAWKPRQEADSEVGDENVIYMLIDTQNKLLYIGEAGNLKKRLCGPHPSIPNWDYFRYDKLPASLAQHRVDIERMLIRDFASVLKNKKSIHWHDVSGGELVNDRIDP